MSDATRDFLIFMCGFICATAGGFMFGEVVYKGTVDAGQVLQHTYLVIPLPF